MQAVKVTDIVTQQGQLILDHPLHLSENSRVEVIVLIEDTHQNDEITDDTPTDEALSDFRQAWHEAMTGQTIPIWPVR